MAAMLTRSLGRFGTGKLVNSPLLESGVTVPISGDSRADDDSRAIKPEGMTVSALSRMISPDGISFKARLIVPTKPRLLGLVRTHEILAGRQAVDQLSDTIVRAGIIDDDRAMVSLLVEFAQQTFKARLGRLIIGIDGKDNRHRRILVDSGAFVSNIRRAVILPGDSPASRSVASGVNGGDGSSGTATSTTA